MINRADVYEYAANVAYPSVKETLTAHCSTGTFGKMTRTANGMTDICCLMAHLLNGYFGIREDISVRRRLGYQIIEGERKYLMDYTYLVINLAPNRRLYMIVFDDHLYAAGDMSSLPFVSLESSLIIDWTKMILDSKVGLLPFVYPLVRLADAKTMAQYQSAYAIGG